MTGLEYGVRYRRSDGTEFDSFSTEWTAKGARLHVKREPTAVAALSRSVGEAHQLNEGTAE